MTALVSFLIASFLASAAIFLFYSAPTAEDLSMKKSILIMTPAIILMLGAIWYFLTSLRTFKPGLRSAYVLLSIGIFLLPIPTALIVLVLSFPDVLLSHVEVIRYIIIASFIAAAVMMYLGIVFFARLLSVKQLLIKSSILFAVAVLGAWISVRFLDGVTVSVAKYGFQSLAASTVITFGATLFAIRIRNTLGAIYTPAINWLIAAFIVVTLDYATSLILSIWPEKFINYLDYSDWPLILIGVTFLVSGYLFWRSGHTAKISDTATYVDSVIHVVRMVSNPKIIDPTLDKMRVITSKKKDDEDLTSSEKRELIEVYLKIENHLIHDDPLRKISRDDLRSALSYDFQQILKDYEPAEKKLRSNNLK